MTGPASAAGAAPSAPALIVLSDRVDSRSCCPEDRCRCECGVCRAHSHYRRCNRCAGGMHPQPRPRLVTVTEKAALAFGEWPPAPRPEPVDHLGHLRRYMRERPEVVS